jgi:hypothetical protein
VEGKTMVRFKRKLPPGVIVANLIKTQKEINDLNKI